MRHINIPLFIPHRGCPNQCVFCNQRTISGVRSYNPASFVSVIEENLSSVAPEDEVEIAFFGGSFTGIDREEMVSLLELAYSYVKRGRVKSIRCSTRPDYIDDEVLDVLQKYGVGTVELGLQSISESVLSLTRRGHDFDAEERAAKMITERGLSLVGQMMIGLPGSTLDDELDTANFIIRAGASAARIYPTVVFHDTELCDMAKRGDYLPLSLEEAVVRSARVLRLFVEAGLPVIRIGLHASENLSSEDTYFAGPNHPALGELVESRLYFDLIKDAVKKTGLIGKDVINIEVARGELSKAIGQKRRNKLLLAQTLSVKEIKFSESDSLSKYGVRVF